MGNWCDYEIRAEDASINLLDALIATGKAQIAISPSSGEKRLQINIKELSPSYHNSINKDNTRAPIDTIFIGYNPDGSLFYCNKWQPDDRILDGISKELNNIVLSVHRSFEWFEVCDWWEKNGMLCARDGTPVIIGNDSNHSNVELFLFHVNPNLVRKTDSGEYDVSLPIGANNTWGKIKFTKNEVLHPCESVISIALIHEKYTVNYGNTIVEMSAMELYTAYYKSKEEYRKKMQSPVEIPNSLILSKTISKTGDYYIIQAACSTKLSPAGFISMAVPDYAVSDGKDICITEYGKGKNIYAYNADNTVIKKYAKGSEIKSAFEAVMKSH